MKQRFLLRTPATLFREIPGTVPEPQYCEGCRRTLQPTLKDQYWLDSAGQRFTILDGLGPLAEKFNSGDLSNIIEYDFPCICDLEPPYPHWILAVAKREVAGWDVDPPPPRELLGGGGTAMVDDGRPLPGPKPCTWCGRVVAAQIVERWTARTFREVIEGPDSYVSYDKHYKTPRKMLVYRHVCFFCDTRPPYSHFALVRLKKTVGWEVTPV